MFRVRWATSDQTGVFTGSYRCNGAGRQPFLKGAYLQGFAGKGSFKSRGGTHDREYIKEGLTDQEEGESFIHSAEQEMNST